MVDYETIEEPDDISKSDGHDFPAMTLSLFGKVNIKVAVFLFILSVLIFSDIFVRNVLIGFGTAVDQVNCPTTSGTLIQITMLVIGYIILDLLVQGNYI